MTDVNIFYADDDEDDFMLFKDATQKLNLQAEKNIKLYLHKNGQNLIESIKNNQSKNNIVFLDLNMLGHSGFYFLQKIKQEPILNKMPIIMYSTSYDSNNVKQSFDLGANYYAVKPYDFNDLIVMISKIIDVNWDKHKINFENFVYTKD